MVVPAFPQCAGMWRLIYFDAPTRGEQVRVLFAVSGTPYQDVRLNPFPQGLLPYKRAAMGEASPLCGTDQCPAVTSPDGTQHCVEASEIMRFVGQSVGLAPVADSAAEKTALAMNLVGQRVLNEVFYPLLKPMVVGHILAGTLATPFRRLLAGSQASYLPRPALALSQILEQIETTIRDSGGPYVCGAELSFADVSLYTNLNLVLEFRCFASMDLLSAHPKTAAMLAAVDVKARGWMEQRVRDHQLGYRSVIEFFAVTNTPFVWSRQKAPHSESVSIVRGTDATI